MRVTVTVICHRQTRMRRSGILPMPVTFSNRLLSRAGDLIPRPSDLLTNVIRDWPVDVYPQSRALQRFNCATTLLYGYTLALT